MSEMFSRNVPDSFNILKEVTVGIAGCGGIGSNVATSLTRSGVGSLIIADMDLVEITNLNRQHYFQDDIGKTKVDALSTHLHNINPDLKIITHFGKVTRRNYLDLFKNVDILIEAFDLAEEKKWLIEGWMKNNPTLPIIGGSGLSGTGKTELLKVQRSGQLTLCGDQESDMSEGLIAPRVIMVANMMAYETIFQILKDRKS
ncbi:MAG: hypothetical protein A2202_01140 [Bdellovibrionales bacterium RIFOXYA1_FULL_36_14]|nr:MAG: hypothetical protein A2202_01140 [Bdellovibrionales bacterium RIFOXYA1_FULL_36_14]